MVDINFLMIILDLRLLIYMILIILVQNLFMFKMNFLFHLVLINRFDFKQINLLVSRLFIDFEYLVFIIELMN